jgi:hypothetical protein
MPPRDEAGPQGLVITGGTPRMLCSINGHLAPGMQVLTTPSFRFWLAAFAAASTLELRKLAER